MSSSPAPSANAIQINIPGISPVKSDNSAPSNQPASECEVIVQINWPTGIRKKVLPKELSSLGKMLCRGTYKQIARAAWKCKELQKDFLVLIGKQIHKECSNMCRKVGATGNKKDKKKLHVSCLGRTDKDNILQFSFEKLSKELEDKAPLFQLVLKAASLRTQDTSNRAIQSIGVAAAVCLKSRSKNMIALQLILAIINNLSGFMVINIFYFFSCGPKSYFSLFCNLIGYTSGPYEAVRTARVLNSQCY